VRDRLVDDLRDNNQGNVPEATTGRTVLVTGASSGIGRATAVGLAAEGARLILVGRSPERCEETLAEIRRRTGRDDAVMLRADLSSQKEVRRLAEEVLVRADRLHVLVNNAGVTLLRRETTVDGFEATFATNHLAYFLLTGLLLPRLRESAPARIVNVASDAHRFGRLDLDDLQNERRYGAMRVYGQSKTANILFTQELARRIAGSRVTANALHPGGIRSNLGRSRSPFAEALRRLVSGGTKLRPFSKAIMEACEKAAFELYRELDAKSAHWRRIYPGWKKFRDEEFLWFRVAEGTYDENIIMWKNVILQGAGAGSTIINASTVGTPYRHSKGGNVRVKFIP